ncbi:MAG: FKBP-type peptidyl-prolyl cis-trans isomerase [Planctomycetota bacterium]|nr:FKBP-type peptidyl-prolyl cis-trans isomerase [Planctomycetota bacterium]
MIRPCTLLLILTIAVPVVAQDPAPEKNEAPKLETTIDKASYAIGYNIGNDIKHQGLEPNPKALAAGIMAALAGDESLLSPEEVKAALSALQAEMQKKTVEKAVKTLEVGKAFLEANKKKEGVKVTKSGLQYVVLKEGTGEMPTRASTVSTHYRGTFIDGKMFDSSYAGDEPTAADEPVSFPVTGVIAGWTEALQLMKVGAKYRLFVPSELAYKAAGRPSIPPNSVLLFDIELVSSTR